MATRQFITDGATGLRAVLVIDSLGRAADGVERAVGGIRIRRYDDDDRAQLDAEALARAMSRKCRLAGLPVGGAKLVVSDHPGFDRQAGLRVLGERIAELGGMFWTAGDLGTTAEDLASVASTCPYVRTDETNLAEKVAASVLLTLQAAADSQGWAGLPGKRAILQGCGSMGRAVAAGLAREGVELILADLDQALAERVGRELGAEVIAAEEALTTAADALVPCASGGVLTPEVVNSLKVQIVCGPANNQLTELAAADRLHERGVLFVPDALASAGAVIEGVATSILGLPSGDLFVTRLQTTAREILRRAAAENCSPERILDRWS